MKNATSITFLLDDSGSMQSMRSEPIDGFNKFLLEQKDPSLGDATISLIKFGTRVQKVYIDVPIQEARAITTDDYQANGMTSLRDAICTAIVDKGMYLASLPEAERPNKVLFIILTDGDDTASTQYSTAQVADMIEEQTKTYNWVFDFMGTTQASITAAKSFGIAAAATNQYANNAVGLATAYAGSAMRTSTLRSARPA